jgi:hypothetical protein
VVEKVSNWTTHEEQVWTLHRNIFD